MIAATELLVGRALKKAVRNLGGSVEAVIVASPFSPTFGFCGERLKVYWAADDFVAGAGELGQSAARLGRAEAARAAEADRLVVSSPNVADGWRRRGYDPQLIPFGCDADMFAVTDDAPLPTEVRLPSPIVGFVGHLADRIDIGMLTAVAEREHSVLLVGPRHRFFDIARLDDLLRRPNVQWVGPKPFEQLPSYQRVIDVGIVPYTNSGFNQGSFPLKTLEYLAAGRPVVSSDLPASRWLENPSVLIASDPSSFADAVDRALLWPRTTAIVDDRRRFARRHSWASRAADFAAMLGLATVTRVEEVHAHDMRGSERS